MARLTLGKSVDEALDKVVLVKKVTGIEFETPIRFYPNSPTRHVAIAGHPVNNVGELHVAIDYLLARCDEFVAKEEAA